MKTMRYRFIIVLSLVVLIAGALGITYAGAASNGGNSSLLNVRVTNTTDEPVPMTLGVSNTFTTEGGPSWLPNSPTYPVYVKVVPQTKMPVWLRDTIGAGENYYYVGSDVYTVPSNKWLIVTDLQYQVSGQYGETPDQVEFYVYDTDPTATDRPTQYIPPTPHAGSKTCEWIVAPGSQLMFYAHWPTADDQHITWVLNGYLVDQP